MSTSEQDYFWFNGVDGEAQWEDPYAPRTDGALSFAPSPKPKAFSKILTVLPRKSTT